MCPFDQLKTKQKNTKHLSSREMLALSIHCPEPLHSHLHDAHLASWEINTYTLLDHDCQFVAKCLQPNYLPRVLG